MSETPEFVITLGRGPADPKPVTLAFTFGLKSIEKGQRTAIILLLDGIHVARPGAVDGLDIGEPFLPVKDMVDVYLSQGGQLLICGSCWKNAHLTEADRRPGTGMITADGVIDALINAKGALQFN